MAEIGLLESISPFDLFEFKKDFVQVMKVTKEMDRYYGNGNTIDTYLSKFDDLIQSFNRKYPGITLKVKKSVEAFTVRIFAGEKNIKDFFANSASKIPGLKSIGRSSPDQADVSNMEKFAAFLDTIGDKISISYTGETGSSSLNASLDRKEKMAEIIYDDSILNENSASFKACAYYALKEAPDKKIDVYSEASTFGFYNLLNEVEKREWHDTIRRNN